jgi:hypothetical protein
MKEFLELLPKCDKVKKGAAGFHLDDQIDITIRTLFAPRE